jgi:hypothetical protein
MPKASELQKVHNMILSGEYNPKEQTRISFLEYVDKEMDSTSPVKRAKGCGCKRECNKSCGCKKKDVKCHSGCFCNGNCDLGVYNA